jgi:hypothetical protein
LMPPPSSSSLSLPIPTTKTAIMANLCDAVSIHLRRRMETSSKQEIDQRGAMGLVLSTTCMPSYHMDALHLCWCAAFLSSSNSSSSTLRGNEWIDEQAGRGGRARISMRPRVGKGICLSKSSTHLVGFKELCPLAWRIPSFAFCRQ